MQKFKYFFCFIILYSSNIFAVEIYENSAILNYEELSLSQQTMWARLLHYENDRSIITLPTTFFLSPNGHISPKEEYEATVEFIQNNQDAFCRYPQRYKFITRNKIDYSLCKDLLEYKNYIHIDNLYYVIASEDSMNPVSAMGHSFIMAESTNVYNQGVRYAINYGAHSVLNSNFIDTLVEVLKDKMSGAYFVEMYDDVIHKYVSEEDRSLWEFQVSLTKEERDTIEDHLYELKGHNINYSVINNNCSNGAEMLLGTVSEDFIDTDKSLFETPYSYLQFLDSNQKLTNNISIRPSISDKYAIQNEYIKTPLNVRDASELKFMSLNGKYNDVFEITYFPLFKNVNDDTNGSTEIAGSEFFKFKFRYDWRNESFFMKELSLVNLEIYPNSLISFNSAKNFTITFVGNEYDTHTRLYPEIKGGIGYSIRANNFIPYFLLSGGTHLIGSPQLFTGINVGFFIDSDSLGRFNSKYERYITNHGYYHDEIYKYKINWSKLVYDNLSIDVGYQYDKTNQNHSNNSIVMSGITVTF